MLRHRRFLLTMQRLALMGALLMAVAPVISRWVQAHADVGPPAVAQVIQAMCHGQALPKAVMQHVGHAMTMDRGLSMSMDHDAGMAMPSGHEGAACDYCVLAANLLPFVLVLLLLPLLQPAVRISYWTLAPPRLLAFWPAHAARGPPHFAAG